MTTVTMRTVEYPADGLTMIGYLALPTGADRRPAVLIGPEGPGLDDVQRRRADALAELGYVGWRSNLRRALVHRSRGDASARAAAAR